MKFTTARAGLLATTAFWICAASAANANQVFSVGFGPDALTQFSAAHPIVLTLPGYDPSAAPPLTSIVLTLSVSGTAQINVLNSTGSSSEAFLGASATIPLSVTSTTADGSSVNLALTAGTGGGTVAVGTTDHITGIPVAGSLSINIPVVDFLNYEGTAITLTFDVTHGAANFSGSETGEGLSFGGSASLSGNVTIAYNNAPEPTSLALLGTALIGAPLLRRRRAKSA